jgi:hypothetical protein
MTKKTNKFILFIILLIPILCLAIPFLSTALYVGKVTNDWSLITDNWFFIIFIIIGILFAIIFAFAPKHLVSSLGSEEKGILSKKFKKIITGIISLVVLLSGIGIILYSTMEYYAKFLLIPGIVITVGGLIMFVYYFLKEKEIPALFSMAFVFQIIGFSIIITAVIIYNLSTEKSLVGMIVPIALAIPFIVVGIEVIIKSKKNINELFSISAEKQALGYKGLAAVSIYFIYAWLLGGILMVLFANDLWIKIIGIIALIFVATIIFKKIQFYIKYVKYIKGGMK